MCTGQFQSLRLSLFSPLVTMTLFSRSVTLFPFCEQILLYHFFSFHILSDIIWYLSFSVWHTLLTMILSSVHPCCCKWHYFIPFYGWVIFHCIYVLYLHPFICQWTLLPCHGYSNQCCCEHRVHVSFKIMVFSRYMLRSGVRYLTIIPEEGTLNTLSLAHRLWPKSSPSILLLQSHFSHVWLCATP